MQRVIYYGDMENVMKLPQNPQKLQEYILSQGGSIEVSPDELMEMAWPTMSRRAKANVRATLEFSRGVLSEWMR